MAFSTSSPPLARHTLISAILILLIAMGVRATFGLFMQPMGNAHGWDRELFSLAFAVQNLTWGFGAILFGGMADRFGSGRTIVLSAALYALGVIGLRFSHTPLELFATAGILVGLGQAGTTFAVVLPAVARSVPIEQRSVALGAASAGGSLGQFTVVPLGQQLISAFDWSGALWLLSIAITLCMPLAWALRGKPEQQAGAVKQSLSMAVGQALKHPSFHFLFWSYFVCGFHTAFITLHLPAYVADQGLTARDGAFAVATIGLLNIFGSYWAGHLGGRYSKKALLTGIYLGRAVFIAVLLCFPLSRWTLYLFAGGMGLFWLGTVPLTTGLVAQIYGMRFAGTLTGIVFLGHQLGSFIGVWLGGRVYVQTGSYDLVWQLGMGLSLAAAALSWPIRETPVEAAHPA